MALYVTYVVCILQVICLVVFTGFFISSRIEPVKATIREVKIRDGVWTYTFAPKNIKRTGTYFFIGPDGEAKRGGVSYTYRHNSDATTTIAGKPVIEKLTLFSHYLIYFRILLIFVLSIMTTFEFLKVIKSVRSISIFRRTNVSSLQNMGKYMFGYLLISGFNIAYFTYSYFYEFTVDFVLLAIIALIFILAEVFKEGNRLQEENQLTV